MSLTNRVALSGLQLIEPQKWLDNQTCVAFDIAPGLERGMMLREKEFRQFLSEWDWSAYTNQDAAVFCSTPALLPAWTSLLVGRYLVEVGARPFLGTEYELRVHLAILQIRRDDFSGYAGQRIVLKGCGGEKSDRLILALLERLQPLVRSIMFGEPCSTVPIYKKGG
ncbi:MAG: DUF2480 family protein [Sphingomonadales bacterium]|nr:DUF2480 family protein [Sphingomonadales bacterium]